MVVKVILNGGIKTCCSVTSPDVVQKSLRAWLPKSVELVVIDKTTETWTLSGIAQFAEKYFHDSIYPLLYIDDTLAIIGGVPDRSDLLGLVNGTLKFGITENDILEAAKDQGLVEAESAQHS